MVTSYLDKQCIFLTLISVAGETPHYGCEKKGPGEEREKKKHLWGLTSVAAAYHNSSYCMRLHVLRGHLRKPALLSICNLFLFLQRMVISNISFFFYTFSTVRMSRMIQRTGNGKQKGLSARGLA